MARIELGKYNKLRVVKKAYKHTGARIGDKEEFGLYLDGGDDGEILMPEKYVPEGTEIGDEVTAFVYLDQDERPVATTEKAFAQAGEFAYLECAWVNQYGAFLDWGVTKNLFCPFREQKRKMEVGEMYIVYIYVDEESYRLVASAKIDKFLGNIADADPKVYHHGSKVDLLVWQKTDLGFKVIIDNKYGGLIYDDQIFKYVHSGDRMDGYIDVIRTDGKIDCTLQPTGIRQTEDFAKVLLDYLKSHNGVCNMGDKTDAEDIKHEFHVSKKVFKHAIGDLYKRRLITVEPTRIALATTGASHDGSSRAGK